MNNKKQKILVVGASGATGGIVVDLLDRSESYTPIAMVRKQEQKEDFERKGILAVLGDLEEDVSHATKNVSKVIFAAGSGGKNVKEVDQEGAKRLTDAAIQSGAEKLVMLSSMGADDPAASEELEDYMRAKQHADHYLIASGIDFTIVRPGALTNNEGTGKINLKEKFENPGKISRADVAKTLIEALGKGVQHNRTFEIIAGDTDIEIAVRS